MAGDPYRRLILDTIAVVISKRPNGDSLIELLRIATPELDPSAVCQSPTLREKLFKTLKLRIHPDKHPGDGRATELYQNVQMFYDECVTNVDCRPSTNGSSGRSGGGGASGAATSAPPPCHSNRANDDRASQRAPYAAAAPHPPEPCNARRATTTAEPYTTYGYNPSTDSHYVSYETRNYADGLIPRYRPSVSWSCFCHHFTNFVALSMVCTFMGFAGYVCYSVLSNGG